MEPPPRFELGPSAIPRRRSDRWSYEGMSRVPGAGLEPACACFKGRPGCRQPTPEWPEPLPGLEPDTCRLQGGCSGLVSYRGVKNVRSAGLEPAATWPSTMPVYLFAARAQESRHPVPTRAVRRTKAKPQPCAAAWLGNQGSNLDSLASEASVLPDYTIPHRVRGAGFEPADDKV
jgi:hypothetical protein